MTKGKTKNNRKGEKHISLWRDAKRQRVQEAKIGSLENKLPFLLHWVLLCFPRSLIGYCCFFFFFNFLFKDTYVGKLFIFFLEN